jgi:heptosyltransferase-2
MTRVLIVAPAWVGDMVMAQSLVAALHARPDVKAVDLLAPPWTAALGPRMPGVGKVHVIDTRHGRFDLALRYRLGRDLKQERYDLAIVLPGSLKAAIPPWAAGIPVRRGYLGEWRYGLLNDVRRLDKNRLKRTIDRFVALAAAKGEPPPATLPPVLATDPARGFALAAGLGLPLDRPIVALCPGAEYGPAKQWPAAHFAALADLLSRRGLQTWIFGSKKDAAIGETIIALAKARNPDAAPVNLAGRTELTEAIDLLGLAASVATNDSGLMHVAAAIGKPLVALYGSTTPEMTPPLGPVIEIVERELPCRPCFERVCPLGHLDCLTLIPASKVAALVILQAEAAVAGRSASIAPTASRTAS